MLQNLEMHARDKQDEYTDTHTQFLHCAMLHS